MKYIGISLITFILLAGCASNNTPPVKKQVASIDQNISKVTTPPPPPLPKYEGELKPVEDTNYSSAYMYPEGSVKKENVKEPVQTPPLATDTGMNKEECIAMISQEKFDKYAAMFGSEAASIKRCNMIQAMNR